MDKGTKVWIGIDKKRAQKLGDVFHELDHTSLVLGTVSSEHNGRLTVELSDGTSVSGCAFGAYPEDRWPIC